MRIVNIQKQPETNMRKTSGWKNRLEMENTNVSKVFNPVSRTISLEIKVLWVVFDQISRVKREQYLFVDCSQQQEERSAAFNVKN